MSEGTTPRVLTAEERKGKLAERIASEVARGARVESTLDYQAVLVTGKRISHVLHLLLTLITVGLWVIVWIILAFTGGEKRRVIAVDEYGFIQER